MEGRSELRQYYEILRRHVTIIALVVALAIGGVGLQLAIQGRQYQADVSVLVTPQAFNGGLDTNPNFAAFQTQYRNLVMNDILYLAKSSEVLRRVGQRVPQVSPAALYREIKVTNLPNTDIVVVSARDGVRDRAVLIATATTQELVAYYAELNQAAAAGTRQFIGQQVAVTKQKLEAAEDSLRAFKTQANIAGLPETTSRMIQRSFELQAMYNAAMLDVRAAQMRAGSLQQRLRSESGGQLASVEIGTNPVVAQLRDRLMAAEADLASLRQVYTDQHPKVQQALGNVADLRARLRQEAAQAASDRSIGVSPIREQLVAQLLNAQVDGEVAQARAEAITPLLGQLQSSMSQLPTNELTFARLQRDAKVNEDLYMRLSALYQDAKIAEQKAGVSGQAALATVDQTDPSPVSSQFPLKAGLGGLLGLVMGCVLALLVDNLDNRVRTPGDAEGTFGVPVLASVPTMNPQNHRALMGESGGVAGTVGMILPIVMPFVLPFLFVMLGGLAVGLLVSKAGPVVGSVAGQAGIAVTQMLHHLTALLG
ncbi:MAG TPA: GNVR domain-containing protein [bacterium]|nr:GNVR domain-containing protein [bacterium]